MGVAAYNRGTQVVRDQTSRQLDECSPAIEYRSERHRIRELELQIRADRESFLRDRDRALAVIRSLRVKLDDSRQQAGFWKQTARRMSRTITSLQKSWQRASALLRLLPPSTVQELRDMHPERTID